MAPAVNRSTFAVYVTIGAQTTCVLPGQTFPKGAAVTNPIVLGKDAASAASDPAPQPTPEPEVEVEDEPDAELDGGQEPPPQSGKGSGRNAWAAYAKNKIDVDDDMSRDDIIDALADEGFEV